MSHNSVYPLELHLGFNVVVPNQSKHIAVINPPSLQLSVLILGSRGRHQDILVSGGSHGGNHG